MTYIDISNADLTRMRDEGTLGGFLRSKVNEESDLIWLRLSDPPGTLLPCELEPILTPEQKKIEQSLPAAWLLPLPKGYYSVTGDAGTGRIATWYPQWPAYQVRAAATRSAMSDNNDLIQEAIYWFDHPMSADEMALQVNCEDGSQDVCKEFGHAFLWRHEGLPRDKKRPIRYWQSGQFLVWLELPKEVFKEEMKAYLEKYPPTWDDEISYEPTRLALGALDRSIPELEQSVDGPLEYLRYSFRRYPFDIALTRCMGVIPGSGQLKHDYESRLAALQEAWAATPADQIRLSDYRDAIVSYRREIIGIVRAARDRIAAHGIEHNGPNRLWGYGATNP